MNGQVKYYFFTHAIFHCDLQMDEHYYGLSIQCLLIQTRICRVPSSTTNKYNDKPC